MESPGPKTKKKASITSSRHPSIFRNQQSVVSPGADIRQLANHFFTHSMHVVEQERFMDDLPELRKMVAHVTFLFGRNQD